MTGILGSLIPGPIGWAIGAFGSAKRIVGSAIDWATGNATHLLLIVIAAVAVWGWLGHHNAAKWEKVAIQTRNARKADAAADRTNHGTINFLIDTLNDQSRMVRAWGESSKAKQEAAQAALRSAKTRGTHAEAMAQAIDLEHAQAGASWPACRSGKAVMAAKNDL